MKVEVNGEPYFCYFAHVPTGDGAGSKIIVKKSNEKDAPIFAEAKSVVKHGDVFSKKVGRKMALTSFLRHYFSTDRAARILFWNSYREMRGGSVM